MQGKKSNLTKIALSKLFEHGLSKIIFAFSLFIALLIMNYVLSVKTSYIDITKNKIFTLSDQTKEFLDKIDYQVDIKAFYLRQDQYRIRRLLDLYVEENDNISFEIIDPLENPLMAQNYDIGEDINTIIFEAPNKTTRLRPPESGKYFSEREITTAFYRLITDEFRTIYFTEGHGELSLNETSSNGMSHLFDRLTQLNYDVKTINLMTVSRIPEDCDVLVIVGAYTAFSEEEIEHLVEYRRTGGNFLLMTLAGADPGLGFITSVNNVGFGNDFVYETASDKTTKMGPAFPIVSIMEPSEITTGLENLNFMFPITSSVHIVNENTEDIMTRLLATSENSWAESYESARDFQAGIMPTRDENEFMGPIVVAVTNESVIMIPDANTPTGTSNHTVRSAFFGSSGMMSNSNTSQYPGNLSLFVNTVNWITRNENVFSLTTNYSDFTPVELTKKQQNLISWMTLFIFPFAIILIGLFVWIKKR